MKPALIELMIDRICGMFPTTNIARNTVKAAWTKDDIMLDASEEDTKQVLSAVMAFGKFPNQLEMRQMFRKVMGVRQSEVGCPDCEGTGFIYNDPDFMTDKIIPRYVNLCKCRGN